jgi:outer membrane protein assembly factor BamB
MWKRILVGGPIAVICVGLVLFFLIRRMNRITPVEVLESVPEDAIVLAEDIDYEYLTRTFFPKNRIWIDFVNTTGMNRLDSMVNRIISRIGSNEQINDLLLKKGLSLSLHLIGRDQLVPLIYIPYAASHSDNDFEQLMLSMLEGETMVNHRNYETETLFDVSGVPGSLPGRFSFACVGGICLLSPSSILVEEAVRTIHSDTDLSLDPDLQMVRKTAGRYVHANIYINYRKLNLLFYPFVSHPNWERLQVLTGLASWGEVDLDIKDDAFILNGMTHADPASSFLLNAFGDQPAVRIELYEVMPSGISCFLHLGIGDRSRFMEGMKEYFIREGTWEEIEAERQRIDGLYGIDPLTDLMSVLDDEMAWFALEGITGSPEEEILVIETRSQSETNNVVMRWIEQYLEVHAFDMQSLLHLYRLDDQTSFKIYRLPDPFFRDLPPGRLFNRYFTILENYLIFGPSVDALSRVIYQNVLHKTFVSDPVFKEMSDYMAGHSNVTLFIKPYPYLEYRQGVLSDSFAGRMSSLELFLRRIPGLIIQYSPEDGLFYQNISCKYTSQIREKALTVWESLLDTTVSMKPALVVNHNTSEKEIFIQDEGNTVYLINSTGRILWKQKIESPILSEVYQIDFYKNGKLQYLFNTREKIHLIDRNGNYVERYPVTQRAAATNPMALFDYDQNKEYRIFVAGEDRHIYVYDKEGNIVPGWAFRKTESTVNREIQHFRIDGKDYIVAADDIKTYFLNRRGRERIETDKRVTVSRHNLFTLDMNIREGKPRWITTDTSGNVVAIYQDGTVNTLLKQNVTPDHYFRMQDMDSDGIPEFIFAEGDELTVTRQDGKRIFSFRVRERIGNPPDIYKFSASDIKIGITDKPRNRIYLINSDGSLYEGFPLEGSTRFSIGYFAGSDSRFNLIVGSTNNFLYNYSIE